MKRMCGFLVASALVACTALGVGPAAGADEVLSGNIKEADNKSGQSTNTGSGIKTNHIQNDAVTSAKIKNGTVGAADLANGAVTSAKIKDGNVLAADLADAAVTSPKIAAGAVTPGKIAFYSRVIVVDVNGGGDFTSPVAALASITDAGIQNRYLVKIMPGIYDVGQSPLQMRAWVDIEGSGEGPTRITGSVSQQLGGLVNGVGESEIRFLTLENTNASDAWTIAFYVTGGGANTSLLHVTAHAKGIPFINSHQAGVYCDMGSTPVLRHVTAIASGGSVNSGVYAYDAMPQLADVTAEGRDGLYTNVGVELVFSNAELRRVAATARGTGASQEGNIGLLLRDSSPIVSDTTALAVGHQFVNTGLRNEGECRPELTNVSAHGIGGQSFGMDNWAQGDGQVVGEFQVTADRCTFRGLTSSVRNDLEYKATFGASKLLGGAVDNSRGGVLLCLASYSGSAELSSICVP